MTIAKRTLCYHCHIFSFKILLQMSFHFLFAQVSSGNTLQMHYCLTWRVDLQYGCHRVCHLKVFHISPTYCLALVNVGFLDGRCVLVCVQGPLQVSVMLWVQAQPSALSWMSSPLCLPGFSTANLCLRWGYRVNMVFYQQESDSPQLSTSISLNHTHTHANTHRSATQPYAHTHENTDTLGVSHS